MHSSFWPLPYPNLYLHYNICTLWFLIPLCSPTPGQRMAAMTVSTRMIRSQKFPLPISRRCPLDDWLQPQSDTALVMIYNPSKHEKKRQPWPPSVTAISGPAHSPNLRVYLCLNYNQTLACLRVWLWILSWSNSRTKARDKTHHWHTSCQYQQ